MLKGKKAIFVILFVVGLFFVFFVWRTFNPDTWDRSLSIVLDGVKHFRKWLDVSGWTKLVFKISYDKYESVYEGAELDRVKKTIENIILKNIDNRISWLWVSDYRAYVQIMDNVPYIVVEIGGIADLDQAKEIIWKTVELEFRLPNNDEPTDLVKRERKQLALNLKEEIENNGWDMYKFASAKWSENIFYNYWKDVELDQLPSLFKNNKKLVTDIEIWKISDVISDTYDIIEYQDQSGNLQNVELYWYTFYRVNDVKTIEKAWEGTGDAMSQKVDVYDIESVFVQDRETWKIAKTKNWDILNGAYFKYASVSQDQVWRPVVAINFDSKGTQVFCDITSENIWNQMAIFVWWNLLTSPVIKSKICWWTAQIDGDFTSDSAKELVDALNDWALPAPLILIQEEKISPTLGANALTGALIAGAVGILAIFVLIFIMYWWRESLVTVSVLVSFMVILWFFIKLVDYALSLSWIAAVVLSIWMAVDANILIYERMREEEKKGRSKEAVIDRAYARSLPPIKDWNISTWLIALLLFMLWSNMFKWFGTMLLVTVLLTLFVNVPLTKVLLKWVYRK